MEGHALQWRLKRAVESACLREWAEHGAGERLGCSTQLWVTHSVMPGAERCLDVCGKEAREPLPARGCREARERSNNRRGALSRGTSAQVREMLDVQLTRAFAQARSFRCEVAAQQPALAQLFRERPPAIRGGGKSIEDRRVLG